MVGWVRTIILLWNRLIGAPAMLRVPKTTIPVQNGACPIHLDNPWYNVGARVGADITNITRLGLVQAGWILLIAQLDETTLHSAVMFITGSGVAVVHIRTVRCSDSWPRFHLGTFASQPFVVVRARWNLSRLFEQRMARMCTAATPSPSTASYLKQWDNNVSTTAKNREREREQWL